MKIKTLTIFLLSLGLMGCLYGMKNEEEKEKWGTKERIMTASKGILRFGLLIGGGCGLGITLAKSEGVSHFFCGSKMNDSLLASFGMIIGLSLVLSGLK